MILRYYCLISLFILTILPAHSVAPKMQITEKDSTVLNGDSIVMDYLIKHHIPLSNDNEIELIDSGRKKFIRLFNDIRQAKHHIHIEYFNLRNDSIGNALLQLLHQKAEEGVEVRVLFDDFGNSSNNRPLKKKHLKTFAHPNLEIQIYDPIRFPYVNHIFKRDHRKIVVIDGIIGYTGGMNVADYYINGIEGIGEWRDMHIVIKGSAVSSLQDLFLDLWNQTAKQHITGTPYYPYKTTQPDTQGKSMAIVGRIPHEEPKLLRHTLVEYINRAQNSIQIVNPYFLPTKSVKRALKSALKRGVDLQIMLSEKSDISFTPDGAIYQAHRLMKKGAKIYLYKGAFHHSKIMMIDNRFCTVGSTNLDSRSLRYDYEVNAFIFDQDFTRQLTDIFEYDKGSCIMLTPELWKKKSAWKKTVGWTANTLTPFL